MQATKSSLTIVVLVCGALGTTAFFWLGRPDARAASSSLSLKTESQAGVLSESQLSGAEAPSLREAAPDRVASEAPAPRPLPPKEASTYAFLPRELEPLGGLIRQHLDAFNEAAPAARLQLGRELLVHSLAVIMCATGAGPIEKGLLGDGDLSFAGQGGKWSFQVNTSTFHFYDFQFPEYPEYMALLRSSYDDQMVPLPTVVELPEDLANKIRQRAQEALDWL